MIAFLSTMPPPAPRGPKIQDGLFCMVGYTGEDGKHYGRRITNPWYECPPPLFLGQVSFLSCDMGSCLSRLAWFCCFTKRRKPEKLCFITAVVGRLVAALLYLACLFSLSSLLFSDHVIYSTHLPASCFACFTTPALVTLFVSWWLFLFLLYFFSAFIAFYFGGWHVDMVG